jgi:hypothetical protein
VTAALSVSEAAYRACMRWGYTDLGVVPGYIHLVAARGYSNRKRSPRAVLPLVRPLVSVYVWLTHRISRIVSAGVELVPIEHFDDRVDHLWQTTSADYPILATRDARWLGWRFDDCPQSDRYARYYAVRRGDLVGYLVFGGTLWNDEPAFEIVDYLAAPRDLMALFAAAVGVARDRNVTSLLCSTVNSRAGPALLLAGFRRRKHGPRFIAHADEENPWRDDLADRRNWFVTAADSDVDL